MILKTGEIHAGVALVAKGHVFESFSAVKTQYLSTSDL